eukprot:2008814-Alexandrium_andersonii.AAC.1
MDARILECMWDARFGDSWQYWGPVAGTAANSTRAEATGLLAALHALRPTKLATNSAACIAKFRGWVEQQRGG